MRKNTSSAKVKSRSIDISDGAAHKERGYAQSDFLLVMMFLCLGLDHVFLTEYGDSAMCWQSFSDMLVICYQGVGDVLIRLFDDALVQTNQQQRWQ